MRQECLTPEIMLADPLSSPILSLPTCPLSLPPAMRGPGNTVQGVSWGLREALRALQLCPCCWKWGPRREAPGNEIQICREWVAGMPRLEQELCNWVRWKAGPRRRLLALVSPLLPPSQPEAQSRCHEPRASQAHPLFCPGVPSKGCAHSR